MATIKMNDIILNEFESKSSLDVASHDKAENDLTPHNVDSKIYAAAGPYANSSPFGLACFALTIIIFQFKDFGWISTGPTYCMGIFVGGFGLFAAGLLEYVNGDTFFTATFTVLATYRMALVSMMILADKTTMKASSSDVGFFRFCFFLFSCSLFAASFSRAISLMVVIFSLSLGLGLISLAELIQCSPLSAVGSSFVLISGFCAFYNMTALLCQSTFKYNVFPMGPTGVEALKYLHRKFRAEC